MDVDEREGRVGRTYRTAAWAALGQAHFSALEGLGWVSRNHGKGEVEVGG